MRRPQITGLTQRSLSEASERTERTPEPEKAGGKTSVTERSNILLKIADRIEQNLELLAVAETWDNGKAVRETLNADLPLAIDHFRYFAGALRAQEGGLSQVVDNIRYIDNTIGLDQLPEKLREIARLRVEYQDVTLKELGEMVSTGVVSKSGVNHRLRKIDEIADALRRGEHVIK